MNHEKFHIVPVPKSRYSSMDAGRLGRKKHIVHALIEMDVTLIRQKIQNHLLNHKEKLSFTAYIIYCLGQSIKKHKHLHAYLNWRRQLVIYEDVNIVTMIEIEKDGIKVPAPHLFESVNNKTIFNIHQELRAVQKNPELHHGTKYLQHFFKLPWIFRRIFYWLTLKLPQSFRTVSSPVLVTSLGMFGNGSGWGIPKPNFTLTVTVGGIAKKPWVVDDEMLIRDILNLTISIDHDIVDGAPAARFVNDLKVMIEGGFGMEYEMPNMKFENSLTP